MICKSLAGLRRLVLTWQQRLKLEHWIITVRWGTKEEIKLGNLAHMNIYPELLRAEILCLKQRDYPDELKPMMDHEADIIHELLHLHLPDLPPELNSTYEAGLNTIAGALLHLRRGED